MDKQDPERARRVKIIREALGIGKGPTAVVAVSYGCVAEGTKINMNPYPDRGGGRYQGRVQRKDEAHQQLLIQWESREDGQPLDIGSEQVIRDRDWEQGRATMEVNEHTPVGHMLVNVLEKLDGMSHRLGMLEANVAALSRDTRDVSPKRSPPRVADAPGYGPSMATEVAPATLVPTGCRSPRMRTGEAVSVLYNDGVYHDAVVQKVTDDGTYQVRWYDGSISNGVTEELMRRK